MNLTLILEHAWCEERRSQKQRAKNETRKEELKVILMWHDNLCHTHGTNPECTTAPSLQTSTTVVTLLTLSNFDASFSPQWLKCMQLAHVQPQ